MDNLNFEKSRAVQEVIADGVDKINQLQATATALRDELDHLQVTYEDKLQELERASRDEHKQLQETAVKLRQELEACKGGS